MLHLIRLADGQILTTVSQADATILETTLIRGFDKTPEWLIKGPTIDLLLSHGLSANAAGVLRQELTESGGPQIELGFEPVVAEHTHSLKGQLQDAKTHAPIGGALVQGFDEDLVDDDALGWTFSRPDGSFQLMFHEKDFTERIAGINIEGAPEVYLKIRRNAEAEWTQFGPQPQPAATHDWGVLAL